MCGLGCVCLRWTEGNGLICKECILVLAWSLGIDLGDENCVWRKGSGGVTQQDPREGCAGSAWVERLPEPWDEPVGLGLEQAGQLLWEDWRLNMV